MRLRLRYLVEAFQFRPQASQAPADQPLPSPREAHYRGSDPAALAVGDDRRLAALHDGDFGIRGTQVNADCFCHAAEGADCWPESSRASEPVRTRDFRTAWRIQA